MVLFVDGVYSVTPLATVAIPINTKVAPPAMVIIGERKNIPIANNATEKE
jgi:hypothetical protein